jgi:serine/threonine protein kinase/tetratricopeptide (TPR) repeat protein
MSRLERRIRPASPPGRLSSSSADSDDAALADLVDELTERSRAGTILDREALAREYPSHARHLLPLLPSLEALAQAGAGLPSTTSARGVSDEEPPQQAPDNPPVALPEDGLLGDFHVLGEVGRGGMGVVYEAEQVSLSRRVALKILPFASALQPRQVQRFKNEALAAAHLHHAHIVPVYAVGCERGVHFYAMQFIRGHTLAGVVRTLRRQFGYGTESENIATSSGTAADCVAGPAPLPGADVASLGKGYVRSIAGLILQSAEALEYAHQCGVVHRDVKPGNLMVDNRGHVWVTDFGLASCQRPGIKAGLTGPGEMPGTLRYMSPEQALGPACGVDHRTDVYGLGATLYELLTLEPACPGETRHELMVRLAAEGPRPPRRFNRAVPVDLETIVLKALARSPADRYPTAGELADDLRRFLDDSPIRARRLSPLERCKRWLRSHRGVARATAAAVLVAVVALAVSTVVVVRQRDVAEARRLQARQVVDRMYTDIAERWLAQQPYLEPLQREYLQLALAFYEDLMAEDGRDPAVLLATAQAARRVGDIRQKFGEYDAAESAYARCARLLHTLTNTHPGRAQSRAERGFLLNHRGNLLRRRGRLAEAHGAYEQAVGLFAGLVLEAPDNTAYADALAGTNNNLGMSYHDFGDSEESEAAYRRALALLVRLVEEHPGQPSYRHDLAGCNNNLAYLLNDLGRRAEAEKAYQSALELWRAVAAECPGVAGYRQGVAACLHNLGNLRAACGRPREAEEDYRTALLLRARLAENFPQAVGYRQELADSQFALGMLLCGLGKFPEADQLQRAAFRMRNELAAASPAGNEFRRDLATSHYGFGRLLAATGRTRQAEEAYRAALSLLTEPSDATGSGQLASPGRQELTLTRHHFGLLLAHLGRYDEAEKFYRQSLAACEESPSDRVSARTERCELYSDLAYLMDSIGRTTEAEQAYRRALTVSGSTGPSAIAVLAEVHDRLGVLLYRTGRTQEAEKCFEFARASRLQLAKDHPDVPAFHGELAWFLAHCPDVQFRDPELSVASATRACELAPLDGNQWVRVGAASYRSGDWRGAVAALEKSAARGNALAPADRLFLAMSHWQLGEKQKSQECYDRVHAYVREHGPVDEELRRFLAEAEALIPHPRTGPPGTDASVP